MIARKRLRNFIKFIAACLLCWSATLQADFVTKFPLINLDLTEQQMVQLAKVKTALQAKQYETAKEIAKKLTELQFELRKEDRFSTEGKAKKSALEVNRLIKDLSALHGKAFKTDVEYMLKAKDILTREQRMQFLAGLEFEMEVPRNIEQYQELDFTNIGLALSPEQTKQLLRYRTQMKVNELNNALEIDLTLVDLISELSAEGIDQKKVNKYILTVTELANQMLSTNVGLFLKAKDVLTVEQKKQVLQMIMMSY
jgi:Spy/CpxP family protein refolding chaperone